MRLKQEERTAGFREGMFLRSRRVGASGMNPIVPEVAEVRSVRMQLGRDAGESLGLCELVRNHSDDPGRADVVG